MTPMKKLCLTFIALVCVPVLAAGQVVEEIVARVNNQIITRSEFSRSKDQLRDEVKQQDPNDADKVYGAKERTSCATSSTSNFFSTKAKISALPAIPIW